MQPSDRRIQYWTFGDVAFTDDRPKLAGAAFTYDLTFLTGRSIGWERSKTHGHVHTGSEGGYAEVYEVLEGHAGFLLQDLFYGPSSSFAVLIEAGPGETVVVPPLLHHAAVNLGSNTLVLGDVVSRRAEDDYVALGEARGMSYYIATDVEARPNPAYSRVPPLEWIQAADWAEALRSPLYVNLLSSPSSFDWLSEPARFARRFPELWARYRGPWPATGDTHA